MLWIIFGILGNILCFDYCEESKRVFNGVRRKEDKYKKLV